MEHVELGVGTWNRPSELWPPGFLGNAGSSSLGTVAIWDVVGCLAASRPSFPEMPLVTVHTRHSIITLTGLLSLL